MKPFVVTLGGEAGFGIMSSGLTFSKIVTRSGYHIFDYSEYPSIVRGGHNVMYITIADEPISAGRRHIDFLLALNQETIDLHHNELLRGSGILYDAEQKMNADALSNQINKYAVPFYRLAREMGGSILMKNTVALGAALALLGGELQFLNNLLAEEFKDKHPEAIALNQRAAKAGFDYIYTHYATEIRHILSPRSVDTLPLVMTGNDAIALGAIAAGMQFAAIYPMTPTSNILHVLAPLQEKYNFIYKQPEDEIAAIIMAIGASFAGARSMVATSGGGFCLMTEGYGLAGMTETPLVIIEGMRGGPATGLPTWTEQGDLRFVLHAHQGDFPRIVLSAGDIAEAFYLTRHAFNLADKYQTPVVLLVDKHLCENYFSAAPFSDQNFSIDRGAITLNPEPDYARYALNKKGISPRTFPGIGNHFVANSDEHDETGYTNESSSNRLAQMNKRMDKLKTCEKEDMTAPKLYGPAEAELTIVAWGSTKGAILEALKECPHVNFLYFTWLNPFPVEAVASLLSRAKCILNIEANYSAQLAGLIKEKTGIAITHHFLKYDGRPFYPEEVIKKIKDLRLKI